MTLPAIPNAAHEQELVRAFLAWLNDSLGDQQELATEELLLRYGYMRLNRMDLLNDWARKDKPPADNRMMKARDCFDSGHCPACFGDKRKSKDFICTPCWRRLPRELKEPLLPGWKDGDNVENFFRALNWLRLKASEPVVCR
ncbi:MAG TPA: hypothetical protein VKW06_00335 [Candidatus Angelobacter sp.]|nr:hypothetical protein [Candidatus Angelobacter sp.]